ncbi:MAG: class I SAM-dependent methyltransferase [Bryobacteraceae bacterium]
MYKEISQCRVCGNTRLDPILNLGMQALTGVFPRPDETVEEGPLELVKCHEKGESCGLVQLLHSFDPEQMYGDNYGYRSGLNQSMVSHLRGLASVAKSAVALAPGDVILDIGSNDSTLLQAMYEPGVMAAGMDPTGAKFKSFYPPHIQLVPEFFSAATFFNEVGPKRPKIISSIAMFYDLEAPLQFMMQIREVLADDGVWIFEQSYLPTMIDKNSYDTVCHEHLEYYRLKQIVWMAKRAGLEILDVDLNDANGGSFRILAGHEGAARHSRSGDISAMLREEEARGFGEGEVYAAFRDRVLRHRDDLRGLLDKVKREGKVVVGCGASTKGNVVLQFCELGPQDLSCIAEVNPEKFGRVTPGTLIPIVPEEQALALQPDAILVLPWHFRKDFISRSQNYLAGSRSFIFPLPAIEVYGIAQGANNRM